MKRYQRILISAHSKLDKIGWLNTGIGLVLYSNIYFAYKRHLEGRQLVRELKFLKKADSGFSTVSLVIDVGAHIGFFTREVVRLFPGVKVISIEPPGKNSRNFMDLNENLIDSKFVSFQNVAAWSFDGEIPFYFEDSNTANNRFDSTSPTLIRCLTIDSLTKHIASSTLIIKIDVQGFEFEVLEGALATLNSNQVALLIELDESALQARGKSSEDLLYKLQQLGFYPKNLKNGGQLDLQQIFSMLKKRDCLDFLFLPLNH